MKIMMEFSSMAKNFNAGKDTAEIDLPEGSTTIDLLNYYKTSFTAESGVSFLVINGVKSRTEEALKDGDHVKMFPKAFAG